MAGYVNVMDRAESVVFGPAQPPVTGIRLWYDDDKCFFAGDKSGTVLETNAETTATQAVAEQALAKVAGYVYRPFRATRALMDMEAELGDGVNVGGIYGQLVSASIVFGNAKAAEISAPDTEETDHEFVILSPQERKMLRKLTLGKSYFGTKITRQNGLEVVKTAADGTESARVRLNSDVLAFYDADGAKALYFDAAAGKYKFRGDVEITGGTMNVNDQFIVEEDGRLTIADALEFDPTIGKYIFSGDVQITHGSLDVSGDVEISGNVMLGGSLKLTGNIDLSGASSISWGSNDPSDGSGISASEARTIIEQELVSSPNIAGGKFWDIAQEAYITLDADYGAGHRYADLRFFQGSSEIFHIAADNTLNDFDLSSGGRVTVALNTIAGMLLYAESTYNGEFWVDTICPQGTWSFEDANVEGLTKTYVPVWG